MGNFLTKLHGLPEDARKLLAGICMVVAAIAFFGIWTSFVSSHLVALTPGPSTAVAEGSDTNGQNTSVVQGGEAVPATIDNQVTVEVPPAPDGAGAAQVQTPTSQALSPAGGIADTVKGFADAVSGVVSTLGKQSPPTDNTPNNTGDNSQSGFFDSLAERARGLGASIGAASDRVADYLYQKLSAYVPPNL